MSATGSAGRDSQSVDSLNPAKRDHRQEVTDSIINMLEQGVAPWQKPWQGAGIPINPTTEKAYRGGNAVHLLATAIQRGYEDPRWMTYKQAAENDWQVKKGEKGTRIEFWEVKQQSGTKSEPNQPEVSDEPERRFIHRIYTVFNAKQIEGIPAYAPKERTEFGSVEAAERILSSSGANINHDQADRCFYSRTSDSIHLTPKETFKDASGYYGTALHELSHWTGHPSRLNRSTLNESYRFGDPTYAREELRAELASLFIAAETGIPHDPENHAAYVGSWIEALRKDKNEIFRAAHDASAAADFIIGLDRDRFIADVRRETSLSAGSYQQEISRLPDAGFKPGDRVMAHEPYHYGGAPKRNPWVPAIVQSLYHNDQMISYARNSSENGNMAVEYAIKGSMRHATPKDLEQFASEFTKVEGKLPSKLREAMAHENRESLTYVSRLEPDSGTVAVHDKRFGNDHHTPIDPASYPPGKNGGDKEQHGKPGNRSDLSESFQEARALAIKELGQEARTYVAQTQGGMCCGKIIGETQHHLVQSISSRTAVAHLKQLVENAPEINRNVVISYRDDKTQVRELRERSKTAELAR